MPCSNLSTTWCTLVAKLFTDIPISPICQCPAKAGKCWCIRTTMIIKTSALTLLFMGFMGEKMTQMHIVYPHAMLCTTKLVPLLGCCVLTADDSLPCLPKRASFLLYNLLPMLAHPRASLSKHESNAKCLTMSSKMH